MRGLLDRWERGVDAFAFSPWSSLVLAVIGVAWVVTEAMRGKAIGWDGFLTLAALEIALGTRRGQGRG